MIPQSMCSAIGKKAQAQLPSTGSPDQWETHSLWWEYNKSTSSHQIDNGYKQETVANLVGSSFVEGRS